MLNYCDIVSNNRAPSRHNVNQFVKLGRATNDSWEVKDRELICKNAGVWQFTAQYQLLNINSVDTGLDARFVGWFNVNGKNIKDSAAVSYASKKDGTAVLTLALSFDFKEGDRVKFGVRSESTNDTLNIVISDVANGSRVVAPALIASAIKIL